MIDLDALTNEIEQGFMQGDGWKTCRYLLGKLVEEIQQSEERWDHRDEYESEDE